MGACVAVILRRRAIRRNALKLLREVQDRPWKFGTPWEINNFTEEYEVDLPAAVLARRNTTAEALLAVGRSAEFNLSVGGHEAQYLIATPFAAAADSRPVRDQRSFINTIPRAGRFASSVPDKNFDSVSQSSQR